MPALLVPYHRSLNAQIFIADSLRSHSLPFEEARLLVTQWAAQAELTSNEWVATWEDLCAAEIEKWNARS